MNWIASSLHFPLLSFQSRLSSQPFPQLWLGALDSSLHAFRGPKALEKNRHRFQSNEGKWVRLIQICEASEWYTTLTVNDEDKEKQNGGIKETGFPVGSDPARLCGAKKMNCSPVWQPDLFYVLLSFWTLFSHELIALGVCVAEDPWYFSTVYLHLLHRCSIWPRRYAFSRRVLQFTDAVYAFNQFLTQHCINSCSWSWPLEQRLRQAGSISFVAFRKNI